jgi:hypothetical protein
MRLSAVARRAGHSALRPQQLQQRAASVMPEMLPEEPVTPPSHYAVSRNVKMGETRSLNGFTASVRNVRILLCTCLQVFASAVVYVCSSATMLVYMQSLPHGRTQSSALVHKCASLISFGNSNAAHACSCNSSSNVVALVSCRLLCPEIAAVAVLRAAATIISTLRRGLFAAERVPFL